MKTEKELAERLLEIIELRHSLITVAGARNEWIEKQLELPETKRFLFTSEHDEILKVESMLDQIDELKKEKIEILNELL